MSLSGTRQASTRLFLRCYLTLCQASSGGGASPIPTTLPWGQHRCFPQGTEVATKDQRSLAEGHFGDPKLQNSGSRRAHGDAEYIRQGSGALVHLAVAIDIEGAHTLHAVSPNSMTSLMRSSCCAAWQAHHGGCLPTSSNPNSLPEARLQTPFVDELEG